MLKLWQIRRMGSVPLTDAQKKKIEDVAIGEAVTQQISIHDQIAAIRKQVTALSASAKVSLVDEMANLETVVSNEKSKRKTTISPKKAKKI